MRRSFFYFFRVVTLVLCLIFCFLTVGTYLVLRGNSPSSLSPPLNYLVVIDAGHGGIDGGVRGVKTGVLESEINLAIALRTKEVFKQSGIAVILTRENSGGLYGSLSAGHKKRDMNARKQIIQKSNPTLVISIHQNQYRDSTRRGGQVFFYGESEGGRMLANYIQTKLNKISGSGREYSALKGDYYILDVSPCPAVIVECGFLSNPQDEALLITGEYQSLLAESIYEGVVQYLSDGKTLL